MIFVLSYVLLEYADTFLLFETTASSVVLAFPKKGIKILKLLNNMNSKKAIKDKKINTYNSSYHL